MQSQNSQAYTLRLMVWAGMAFAPVMYFVVIRMVTPAGVQDNPTLVNILLIMAVGMVAASLGVKNYFRQRAASAGTDALVRAGELVAITMCEAAALFGVVAWFVTATPHYYWFLILGAAGMLLHFPQREAQ